MKELNISRSKISNLCKEGLILFHVEKGIYNYHEESIKEYSIYKNNKNKNEYLSKLLLNDIKVYPIEEYIEMKIKILHKCICGNEWKVRPMCVVSGDTCGCKRKKSNEEYLNELKDNKIKEVS